MTVHSKICPPYNNRILDQTSQNWFTFEDESADNTEGRIRRFLVPLAFSAKLLTPFWRQLTYTRFGFSNNLDGWIWVPVENTLHTFCFVSHFIFLHRFQGRSIVLFKEFLLDLTDVCADVPPPTQVERNQQPEKKKGRRG